MSRKKNRSQSQGSLSPNNDSKYEDSSYNVKTKNYGEEGIYEGELVNGKREGHGKMVKKGTVYFVGNWENDLPNGFGTWKQIETGNRHEGNYKDGKRHGVGVYLWANGDKFKGEFNLGSIEGFGRVDFVNGITYCGHWKKDKMSGMGIKTYPDGSWEEGMFKQGKAEGWLFKYYANGDRFQGYYFQTRMTGFGLYYWRNGDNYTGIFDNNKFSGIGIYQTIQTIDKCSKITTVRSNFQFQQPCDLSIIDVRQDDKQLYTFLGERKKLLNDKDQCIVWGTIRYENGLIYEGECQQQNDSKHGFGTLSFTKDDKDVRRIDPVSIIIQEDVEAALLQYGGYYIGRFQYDVYHGEGKLILGPLSDPITIPLSFQHGIHDIPEQEEEQEINQPPQAQ